MKGMNKSMQQVMKQANQMQNRMKKVQEELKTCEYKGSSGGRAVEVTVNGNNELTDIMILDEVIEADDIEMLESMIIAASNEALKKAKEESQKEMDKITGGFAMPGMF